MSRGFTINARMAWRKEGQDRMPIQNIITNDSSGMLVGVECHLSNNLLNIIVGFANESVGEAHERLRGAFASLKLELPRKRILINLAPADTPKADSGFDLAIAVSIIQTSAPQTFKAPAAVY